MADELFSRLLGLPILVSVFEHSLPVTAVIFLAIFEVRLVPSFLLRANLLSACGVVSAPLFQDPLPVPEGALAASYGRTGLTAWVEPIAVSLASVVLGQWLALATAGTGLGFSNPQGCWLGP